MKNKDFINRFKKRGFTLIEIIMVIILISIISVSSIVAVNIYNNKNEYEKFFSQFDDALEVYLSEHSEIYKNLSENVEGAVITLEVLKNEGLINDNIKDPRTNQKLDYENNYYILSDAVLLKEEVASNETEIHCNGQVEIQVIKNWDILSGKVDTKDIIYVCPKNNEKSDPTIEELKKRIESLENSLSLVDLGGDNWILFDVETDTTQKAYWPEENQDLFAIVDTSISEMKIIYNNYVNNKTDYAISYRNDINCNEYRINGKKWNISSENVKFLDSSKNTLPRVDRDASLIMEYAGKYYTINKPYDTCFITHTIDNITYFWQNDDWMYVGSQNGWNYKEIENDNYNTQNSKKKALYDKVIHNSYILEKEYYYYFDNFGGQPILNKQKFIKDKFGTLLIDEPLENLRSMLVGKTFYAGTAPYTSISASCSKAVLGISSGSLYHYGCAYTDAKSYLIGNYQVNDIKYINYIPVFTIKFDSLLKNIDDYPQAYKNKYNTCTNDDLGSKNCPFVLKLSDGIFSWNG